MSETAANGKRLFRITAGNLRNNHIYVREHYDFFPADCIGPSTKKGKDNGHDIELALDGLNELVTTDIATSAANGKPRGFFRGRRWVRRFFKHHEVTPGDLLALQRLGARRYRLSLARRAAANGRSFTAAEFFAGKSQI